MIARPSTAVFGQLVWAYNFELAMRDQNYFSYLSNFQIEGMCCGYASPLTCEVDTRSFPDHLLTAGTARMWLDQRTTCGQQQQWYRASGSEASECNQPLDPNALVPRYGGCRYEMPLGDCLNTLPIASTTGYDQGVMGGGGETQDVLVQGLIYTAC